MNLFDNGNARLGPLEVELVVGGYGLGAGGRVGVGGLRLGRARMRLRTTSRPVGLRTQINSCGKLNIQIPPSPTPRPIPLFPIAISYTIKTALNIRYFHYRTHAISFYNPLETSLVNPPY